MKKFPGVENYSAADIQERQYKLINFCGYYAKQCLSWVSFITCLLIHADVNASMLPTKLS